MNDDEVAVELFRSYLRIRSVQPDVDYCKLFSEIPGLPKLIFAIFSGVRGASY